MTSTLIPLEQAPTCYFCRQHKAQKPENDGLCSNCAKFGKLAPSWGTKTSATGAGLTVHTPDADTEDAAPEPTTDGVADAWVRATDAADGTDTAGWITSDGDGWPDPYATPEPASATPADGGGRSLAEAARTAARERLAAAATPRRSLKQAAPRYGHAHSPEAHAAASAEGRTLDTFVNGHRWLRSPGDLWWKPGTSPALIAACDELTAPGRPVHVSGTLHHHGRELAVTGLLTVYTVTNEINGHPVSIREAVVEASDGSSFQVAAFTRLTTRGRRRTKLPVS